jgi:rhamnulokinase
MVGGGTQNELLCRLTAEAIGRPVWAGPVEASAIGNLLVQLRTGGWLHDLQEGLEMVKASFPIQVYEPEQATRPEDEKRSALWAAAYERFERLGRSIPC